MTTQASQTSNGNQKPVFTPTGVGEEIAQIRKAREAKRGNIANSIDRRKRDQLTPAKGPSLMSYALTDQTIAARKKELGEMIYFMEGLAARTNITTIFAQPNAGKTLLTLNMLIKDVEAGVIGRDEVIYVNADDGGHKGIEKAEILINAGIVPLVIGENGLTSNKVLEAIDAMAVSGEAKDKVLVLDTMTKFSDTMDKKNQRGFYDLLRRFTVAGGTAIILGHTNKNRNDKGKLVFAGVSDPLDNSDNAYILDVASTDRLSHTDSEGYTHHNAKRTLVIFDNKKKRGDNPDELSFEYITWQGAEYTELLDNVKLTDADAAKSEMMRKVRKDKAKAKRDGMKDDAISIYEVLVDNDSLAKTEFVKLANGETGLSLARVRKVLAEFNGVYWADKKDKESASANGKLLVPVNHPREHGREDAPGFTDDSQ